METKEKKVYLSNFKTIANGKGMKGRIYLDKLMEHVQTDDKGRKFINTTIWENREPDQYGNTHAMVLDTWKPDPSTKTAKSDLPF